MVSQGGGTAGRGSLVTVIPLPRPNAGVPRVVAIDAAWSYRSDGPVRRPVVGWCGRHPVPPESLL